MSDLTGVDKLFHGAFCALSPQQLALSAFNFSILVGGWVEKHLLLWFDLHFSNE